MADTITIGCAGDISNAFTLAQHNLDREFMHIEGITGVFDDAIPDGGSFPLNSGFAARVTTLAQQRLNFDRLNLWQNMVGLQEDCATSCQPPTEVVDFANAQHNWYRLKWIAYNTTPYCLTTLFADHLNIQEQIAQVFMDLKMLSIDLNDEFARDNHVSLAANRWMGYAPTNGTTPSLRFDDWHFATDANGNADTSVIILEAGVDPNAIALLSVGGFLNIIRDRGTRIHTFPVNGEIPLYSDYLTFQDLPLRDTNVRADNRFREAGVLNPDYASTLGYAGYRLKPDQFAFRYNYAPNDPAFPGQTILRRVNAWSNQPMSEGCWSDESEDYENASFQITIMWGGSTFKRQIGSMPSSAGSGTTFNNPTVPWNGMNWVWFNEVNEVTPANMDRNLGFWRLVAQRAAKPVDFGKRGHVILHRRFPFTGITGTCATLSTTQGASVDCTNVCPAMDFFPPPLEEVYTCGCWNPAGLCDGVE
jgi:hypothetical protein